MLRSASRWQVLVLHSRLNAGKSIHTVPKGILLVGHEGEKIIGRLFLLRQIRNYTVPAASVGVASSVQIKLLPLAGDWIECLLSAGDYRRTDFPLSRWTFSRPGRMSADHPTSVP